jgi:HTH domain
MMDLLDLMNRGVDPDAKALDRLQVILDLYEADNPVAQDEALERALAYCFSHWGSYLAGMQAVAGRIEAAAADPVAGSLEGMRWREEGDEPGMIIRAVRRQRAEAARGGGSSRAAVIARYGSIEAARWPTPVEQVFIAAAASLAADQDDPYAPLSGWRIPWHPIPLPLYDLVVRACPLPATVADARDEALTWDGRRRELALLDNGPGEAMLPTACAARHRIVEDLWRRDLAVATVTDLEARLQYWASYGGDDGLGYRVVLTDLEFLIAENRLGPVAAPSANRGDAARRLKAAHPEWSLARIGAELGISRQAVHKHLKKKA